MGTSEMGEISLPIDCIGFRLFHLSLWKNSMNFEIKIFNKTAVGLCLLSGLMFTQTSAFAAATMTIQPSNSGGYLATLSGTINTAGLTPLPQRSSTNILNANGQVIVLGANGSTTSTLDEYSGISGGSTWGSFSSIGPVGSGDEFALLGLLGRMMVPAGYQSGAAISSSATYTTIGVLNAGTYTYTWGTGANADSLTVIISPPTLVPTVASVSPNTGSTAGGTAITITGTDLTGATAITLRGAACTNVTVVSATSATCTTPAGTAGTASVVVTTPGGSSAANTLFTYVTPVASPIPTLSEWAMILMASLLAMFGIRRMRRSK